MLDLGLAGHSQYYGFWQQESGYTGRTQRWADTSANGDG